MKVVLIMAMTADGIIGRDRSHFPDWTCPADKRMFKQVSQQAGVLVMGSRTYDTIGKPLSGRLNVVMTRHPERYVPSENLAFCNDTPEKLLTDLAAKGFQTVVLAGGATINSLFMNSGCIDELLLTIAPKLFGRGLSLFANQLNVDLDLLEIQRIETNTLMLRYTIKKP
jgi:dihydrofolate reductase